MSDGAAARVVSARIVAAVVDEGRSLAEAAPRALRELPAERDRAFAQACAYGVLRHYHALHARLAALMPKPLRRKDADVEALLLVGLYQLDHLATAPHGAVSATVEGARMLGKPWASRLVNGVLRNAQRRPAGPSGPAASEFPPWLVERLRGDWPDDVESLLVASNAHAPLTLRVNRLRGTRDTYAQALAVAGIEAQPGRHASAALRLATGVAVQALPGFEEGLVSVQDEAAQLAAEILAPRAGERVLDACAAPGGKTAQLLEIAGPGLELTALDQAAPRLARVHENLTRLDLTCTVREADAGAPEHWWDGRPFDAILLDAPCTALGVMRRHPDIRLRRMPEDVDAARAAQARLLAALWPLLAPGGRLLYVTCSVLRAENDDVVAAFLAATPAARVQPIAGAFGRATLHGRQVLPGDDDMDGFYYCLINKPPAA